MVFYCETVCVSVSEEMSPTLKRGRGREGERERKRERKRQRKREPRGRHCTLAALLKEHPPLSALLHEHHFQHVVFLNTALTVWGQYKLFNVFCEEVSYAHQVCIYHSEILYSSLQCHINYPL